MPPSLQSEFHPARIQLSSPAVAIPPATLFVYPTRLADAWQAEMLQLQLPAYELPARTVELALQQVTMAMPPGPILKRLTRKALPPLHQPERVFYDARDDADGNIAHILTNVVPPVLLARQHYPNLTVLLRAKATAMAHTAYQLLDIPVLCTDQEVLGQQIAIPSGSHSYYGGLYASLFRNLPFADYQAETPERIFIARKGQRCLLNEAEVAGLLQSYGFQKFYFEDIPIPHQWSLMRNAKAVVALHGAAMASLVFNQQSVKVIELFHPGYVVNLYRTITSAIAGQWCGVMGQLPGDIIQALDVEQDARRFALSPTRIDLTTLERALETLQVERRPCAW